MSKCSFIFFYLVPFLINIYLINDLSSQGVSVNTSGIAGHPSSIVDISTNNAGILIPRLTSNERDLIINPAAGLMIYNTDNKCLEIFEYNIWQSLTCAVCPLPLAAGGINGSSVVCAGDVNVSYSINAVNGATTYSWQYSGSGATFNGNTESITLDFSSSATSGTLSVNGVNLCGNGSISPDFIISVNNVPLAPVAGSHISSNDQIEWNWNSVSNASGYKYNTIDDFASAIDNYTSTSFLQTGLNASSNYSLYVWAYNNCGNSNSTLLTQSTTAGFKIVFKTSTTYSGNLGGVTGANDKCQARATAAGLPGTYKAWISTPSSSPATTFTQCSCPYVLTNGVQIAADWNDLVDGSIPNVSGTVYPTIHLNEFGNVLPFESSGSYSSCGSWGGGYFIFSWNATNGDGTYKAPPTGTYSHCHTTCSDWTSTSGGGDIWIMWNSVNTLSCASSSRLICVQQ